MSRRAMVFISDRTREIAEQIGKEFGWEPFSDTLVPDEFVHLESVLGTNQEAEAIEECRQWVKREMAIKNYSPPSSRKDD